MKRAFILAVAFMAILAAGLACTSSRVEPAASADATPAPDTKQLGDFTLIAGTDYSIAPISPTGDDGGSWELLDSRGGYSYEVYNYVFFNIQSETFHTLLPDNKAVILYKNELACFCEQGEDYQILWLVYGVAKIDTNQDGALNYRDRFSIAISDSGGNGYAELISDVEEVLSQISKDENTLLVIYRSGGKNYLARINIPERSVAATSELPSFGEDVK
jgi:hypothetical protein